MEHGKYLSRFLRPSILIPVVGCGCLGLVLFGAGLVAILVAGGGLALNLATGVFEWLKEQEWFATIDDTARKLLEQIDMQTILNAIFA